MIHYTQDPVITLVQQSQLLIEQYKIKEAVGLLKQAAWKSRDPGILSLYLGHLLHIEPSTSPEYKSALAAYHREFVEPLKQPTPARNSSSRNWDRNRPLRISLIGTKFRECSIASCLLPVLQHTKHQINVYSDVRVEREDNTTRRFRELATRYVETHRWSDAELASNLTGDGNDVVVDLEGHQPGNRLLALARNPAPVLVSYLGCYGPTSITDNIDNSVGWTCERNIGRDDSRSVPRPQPAARTGCVTFGCIARSQKASPDALKLFGKVLAACKASGLSARLLLAASDHTSTVTGEQFTEMQKQQCILHGIPENQLVLYSTPKSTADYLAHIRNHVDIILDSVPYTGGQTIFDGLAVGVPTITMTGPEVGPYSQSARILRAVGLQEFVANSQEDYVAIAVRESRDLDMRFRVRKDWTHPGCSISPKATALRFDSELEKRVGVGLGRCCGT